MAQSYGGFICFLAWASGSVSYPPEKRAVALALINCVSQFGNILGSYVFIYTSTRSNRLTNLLIILRYLWPLSWGPTYNISYSICILMSLVSIAMCLAFRRHLSRLNHEADKLDMERGDTTGYRYILWLSESLSDPARESPTIKSTPPFV
jgi:MFS family permease